MLKYDLTVAIVCENNLMDRNPEHGKVSAHVHRLYIRRLGPLFLLQNFEL